MSGRLILLSTRQMSSVAQLTLEFCRRARRAGHDVQLVTSVRGKETTNAFTEGAAEAGFPPIILKEAFRWDPRLPRRLRALKWAIRRRQADSAPIPRQLPQEGRSMP